MAIRVIKVTGIEAIWDATTIPAPDANINEMMVQIIGWHDVTRYWGSGEGNTTGPLTGDATVAPEFDFSNLPADSTATNATDQYGIPIYRDINGKDRKWKPCNYIVNKYDIQHDAYLNL